MKKQNLYSSSRGFTLVEILIASVLLLILIGPLFSFLRVGQANRSVTLRTTDIEQNARAAMITMGRDITNAGFNFAPQIDLGTVPVVSSLQGGTSLLTPIIPGNNLNRVRVGPGLFNNTDQITLAYVDQTFNNGLPLTGNYNLTGGNATYTLTSGTLANLFAGDLIILSRGPVSAIGVVSSVNSGSPSQITFSGGDPFQINRFGMTDPLNRVSLDIENVPVQPPVLAYRFNFITFFVDADGNLIRREILPPPHTPTGGNSAVSPQEIAADLRTYNCAGTCYYDNIIATGIEDLQFTYNVTGSQIGGIVQPIDDPGALGSPGNLSMGEPFRLAEIRQVNVSLKVRAADRDTKLKDQYDPNKGYLYRFSLNGTFGVRNLFQTNYVPDAPGTNPNP